MRYYVGYSVRAKQYILIYDFPINVDAAHYPQYSCMIGAFRTKRGAVYARDTWNNGNLGTWNQTVSQCEKLAKEQSHHA